MNDKRASNSRYVYTRLDLPADGAPVPMWRVTTVCNGCFQQHQFDYQGTETNLLKHLAVYVECAKCRQGRLF